MPRRLIASPWKIDGVEVDVLALDAVVDRGVAEGVLVGRPDAENFQQGDHDGQFVDVAVGKADAAAAGEGVAGASAAAEIGGDGDFAAEVLSRGPGLLGAAGQIGADQRGLEAIAGFGSQGCPALGVEPAAAEIGG